MGGVPKGSFGSDRRQVSTARKKDFFYVGEGCYDACAAKALPFYLPGQRLVAELLALPKARRTRVVDLGVGTGVTAEHILKAYPNAHVIGVDLFEEMMAGARRRLSRFGNRVELVRSDNTRYLNSLESKVDGIVSAMCIHHLGPAQKRRLFRAALGALRRGGRFVMFDWTAFDDAVVKTWARAAVLDNVKRRVGSPHFRRRWIHHWTRVNRPSPADDMVAWLRKAGFRAETAYRDGEIAVLVARKP